MSHLRLDLLDYENVYVVGDLHGDWDIFNFALKQLGFNYRDFMISVGDLIDRGDKPIECLSYFIHTENAQAIRGNHEDMMIRGLLENDTQQGLCWLQNGGEWLTDYPIEMITGLAKEAAKFPIALTVGIGNTKVGICHAESPTKRWQDYVETCGKYFPHDQAAIWGRTNIKQKTGTPILGVDYTVHGHSVRTQPVKKCNQNWIDTGSVFDTGGNKYGLTISELTADGLVHHRFIRDPFEAGGFRMVY